MGGASNLLIDNVVAFLVVNRDRYPDVATQTVETPQLQFLVASLFLSSGAENCGFSAVAVHRQGVDVPAIMQRHVSQWEVPQIQFIA